MKLRRSVVLAGFSAALLSVPLLGAIGAIASGQAPVFAPDRHGEADSRVAAALADLASENARIASAQDTFAIELQSAARAPKNYLVTFSAPVPASTVLASVWEHQDSVDLRSVFSWLIPSGSKHPIVGEHSYETLGWPQGTAQDAAVRLKETVTAYLASRLDRLRAEAAQVSEDPADQQALIDADYNAQYWHLPR